MTKLQRKLVKDANDLQMAVAGMLVLEQGNAVLLREFLTKLHDDDYQLLTTLDSGRKINYLYKRYRGYLADRIREQREREP
jgi:hypothetical protein